MKVAPTFSSQICGIPCGIVVHYSISIPEWQGSAHLCPSDLDYYGYHEHEWYVVDRNGYRAEWLENKLTPKEIKRIEKEIENYLHDQREDALIARYEDEQDWADYR